jgi:hypothetical protein
LIKYKVIIWLFRVNSISDYVLKGGHFNFVVGGHFNFVMTQKF